MPTQLKIHKALLPINPDLFLNLETSREVQIAQKQAEFKLITTIRSDSQTGLGSKAIPGCCYSRKSKTTNLAENHSDPASDQEVTQKLFSAEIGAKYIRNRHHIQVQRSTAIRKIQVRHQLLQPN